MTENIIEKGSDMLPIGFADQGEAPYLYVVESNSAIDNSEPPTPLSAEEKRRLRQLNKAIKKGRVAFLEVGNALREIKTRKLYRATYRSFAEYCEKEWGFCRVNANRYIKAVKIDEILKSEPNGALSGLSSVSEARAFEGVPEPKINEVAKKAKELAKGDNPTMREIESAKNEVCPSKEKNPVDNTEAQTTITLVITPEKDLVTLSDVVEYARDILVEGAAKEAVEKELNEALELIQFFLAQIYQEEAA